MKRWMLISLVVLACWTGTQAQMYKAVAFSGEEPAFTPELASCQNQACTMQQAPITCQAMPETTCTVIYGQSNGQDWVQCTQGTCGDEIINKVQDFVIDFSVDPFAVGL